MRMFSSYLYMIMVKFEYVHKWFMLYSVNMDGALSFKTTVIHDHQVYQLYLVND